MAKKRKKTAAKRKKAKKAKTARRPIRKSARKLGRAKAAPKRAARKKRARKAKPQGLVERVTSAFKAVVSGVEETEALRAKLEQRGSDETQ
ncbi:MAG: hypothetical protein ACK4UO_15515 [Pseudolabrys sp.]